MCNSSRALAGALVCAAVTIVWLLAPAAELAKAGRYHVYSCRTPNEQPAPTVGWSASTSASSATLVSADTCGSGGALVAGLTDGVKHEVGRSATWTFAAPAGESIAAATLWRAGDAEGGYVANAYYEFWLAGPEDVDNQQNVFDECVSGFSCPLGGVGSTTQIRSSKNLVVPPADKLVSNLFVNASCAGETKVLCPEGKSDPDGYAAVVYVYAADLVLEDTTQPAVVPGSVSGELATSSPLSGTPSLLFRAEDGDSGVYSAVVSVDGATVGSTQLDENGGRCLDAGQTSDGLPAFLYLQPCASAVTGDVSLDTTELTDGPHHVVVTVTDASGNSAPVLDRQVDVANSPAPTEGGSEAGGSEGGSAGEGSGGSSGSGAGGAGAPGGGAGASGGGVTSSASTLALEPVGPVGPVTSAPAPAVPNGSPASSQAVLQAGWAANSRSSLTGRWGRGQAIVGRLLTPGGVPIVGAVLDVTATPASQGARAASLAPVRTDADGRFSLRMSPSSASQRISLVYRAHLGDALPVAERELTLTVPAALILRISPRVSHAGGRIAFAGVLRGRPVPAGGKQLVLQASSPGLGWRTFKALKTDGRGRYGARYRFRLPGPAAYRFRVISPREADFPFARGTSNVVRVRER